MTIKERFEKYITPVPECGCWIWFGATSTAGYGQLSINHRRIYAHRLSWEFVNGPIPKNVEVCHSCDTPSCVNPHHLFLGTHKENMQDAIDKGRLKVVQSGEKNHQAKLSSLEVLEIRKSEQSTEKLATQYHVSPTLIRNIKNRLAWRHV